MSDRIIKARDLRPTDTIKHSLIGSVTVNGIESTGNAVNVKADIALCYAPDDNVRVIREESESSDD